jgi:prolyl 4-hydroxylase
MSRTKWIIFIIIILSIIGVIIWQIITSRKSYFGFSRKEIDNRLKSMATEIHGTELTPIYIFDNFLSDSECDAIMDSVKDKLEPSPLTRQDPNDSKFRTSRTAYFRNTNSLHSDINRKMVTMINIKDKSYSELPQVQHYNVGQEFKAHWDFFDPVVDKSFYDKGQRTWTFMVYLTDVEAGGETYFPNLNQSIKPKKCRAVIWGNILENGDMDRDTKHQGKPIIKGEKGIITKWFKLPFN